MLNVIHKRTLLAIKAVVYTLWPATTWAAQITLGETLATVPALAWLMVFILSTVSGLAALLNRLKTDTPDNLKTFVAAHMLGSWLSGALVFFALEAADLADFSEAVGIALAAYAGARLMERWANTFVNKMSGSVQTTQEQQQ